MFIRLAKKEGIGEQNKCETRLVWTINPPPPSKPPTELFIAYFASLICAAPSNIVWFPFNYFGEDNTRHLLVSLTPTALSIEIELGGADRSSIWKINPAYSKSLWGAWQCYWQASWNDLITSPFGNWHWPAPNQSELISRHMLGITLKRKMFSRVLVLLMDTRQLIVDRKSKHTLNWRGRDRSIMQRLIMHIPRGFLHTSSSFTLLPQRLGDSDYMFWVPHQ